MLSDNINRKSFNGLGKADYINRLITLCSAHCNSYSKLDFIENNYSPLDIIYLILINVLPDRLGFRPRHDQTARTRQPGPNWPPRFSGESEAWRPPTTAFQNHRRNPVCPEIRSDNWTLGPSSSSIPELAKLIPK